MCIDFHGEKNGVMIFRKFFSWYTKGLHKVKPLRELSSRIKTKSGMQEIVHAISKNSKVNQLASV
jgi:tRNA-dihydrouridine synthase